MTTRRRHENLSIWAPWRGSSARSCSGHRPRRPGGWPRELKWCDTAEAARRSACAEAGLRRGSDGAFFRARPRASWPSRRSRPRARRAPGVAVARRDALQERARARVVGRRAGPRGAPLGSCPRTASTRPRAGPVRWRPRARARAGGPAPANHDVDTPSGVGLADVFARRARAARRGERAAAARPTPRWDGSVAGTRARSATAAARAPVRRRRARRRRAVACSGARALGARVTEVGVAFVGRTRSRPLAEGGDATASHARVRGRPPRPVGRHRPPGALPPSASPSRESAAARRPRPRGRAARGQQRRRAGDDEGELVLVDTPGTARASGLDGAAAGLRRAARRQSLVELGRVEEQPYSSDTTNGLSACTSGASGRLARASPPGSCWSSYR